MSTAAILPVKRFSHAKQRLSASLPADLRRSLAEAMVSDVLRALRRTPAIDEIIVVTAEPIASALATSQGARVVPDPEERGHSEAALLGLAAVSDETTRALLLPGDCPALAPADIEAALAAAAAGPSVVVVPDRHGNGTNALVLTPPTAMAPSFGPGSRLRHEELAADAGAACVTVEIEAFTLDVDTPEDLAALRTALETARGTAASTRGLLGRIAA
ncbi:MAG: 2-phospho-L-lactate guanylyltransferase [Solirubrobacteraceae bacterium]|nr:2-phospho-L-lactate guanylyltransferase [Solirubrobacteraceae bacterium]